MNNDWLQDPDIDSQLSEYLADPEEPLNLSDPKDFTRFKQMIHEARQ